MRKRSIALVLSAVVLLSGCGKIEDVTESTVTVDEKGVVTEALVETFSSEQYDLTELESSVKELVDAYNKDAGKTQVTLKKTEVKDETAHVLMEYGTDDDYRGFNQVDFFAEAVKDAVKDEYSFSGDFTDKSGKDVSEGTVPDNCEDAKVVIIREPLCVLVPGTILYVSKNMEILGNDRARLVDDTGIPYENAQVSTEAYGYVIYNEEK
ncbi:MAG: hypothetical protein EOM18_03540 [Clostridia bacterium]|nr:hypothetical protein [Clostridia bacterium]